MRLNVNKPYWVLLSSLLLTLSLSAVVSHTPLTAQMLPSSGTHLVYLPMVQDQTLAPIIQDEIVVKLDLDEPGATIEAINQTYNTITIRPLSLSRAIYLLQAPSDVDIEQLAEAIEDDNRVDYAEPNRPTDAPEAIGRSAFVWGGQDEGPYNGQYAQDMLALTAAHALSQGEGVVVAVIDTGVQLQHPVLAPLLTAARIDFVDGDDEPDDVFDDGTNYGAGHGTHVAGIIHMVAPQAQIMPIRVLDTDGRGYSAVVAEAVLFALENGANVINLSLGMPYESDLLEDVIQEAAEEGVVVVAAAGNLNNMQEQYPAATECVVSVTAVDADKIKADFANFGNWLLLAAPGVGIHSTLPVDGYGSWSGTSMATPFAAGQAALLLSMNPDLNAVQVVDLMGGTAENLNPYNPGYPNQLGLGLIDIVASLNALQAGNIPDLELLGDDCTED
jgi:subtilisin family serine protease